MTSERRFKTCKLQGEWAELLFMTRAAEHGFSVSKPWGESQAYDVTVESEGKLLRVQVKSTASTSGYKGYVCSFVRTGMPPYRREHVDFFAIYVIPEEVWYIIPSAVATRQKYNILLSPQRKKQKYIRYIEAWGLLRPGKLRSVAPSTGDAPRFSTRSVRGQAEQDKAFLPFAH